MSILTAFQAMRPSDWVYNRCTQVSDHQSYSRAKRENDKRISLCSFDRFSYYLLLQSIGFTADSSERYRRNEQHRERSPDFEQKMRFDDTRGMGRPVAKRNRSISPRRDANRGRAIDRERDNNRSANFSDRSPR